MTVMVEGFESSFFVEVDASGMLSLDFLFE